ncbi:hypothetical protein NL676_024469 [Syzygium grande]|nr:hypothetical protein NL676_024469 [Syzygium grande]
MAYLVRPLRQWPRLHHHHGLSLFPYPSSLSRFGTTSHHHHHHLHPRHSLVFILVPSSRREVHYPPRGLRFPNSAPAYDPREGDVSDSDSNSEKSRNRKKREARRAVRWGMELASFSNPQIKRILRVASLEQEVLDALVIAKRLGPDVREGKRRQFNYIDALIEATKDGEHSRLQAFSVSEAWVGEDDDEGEEDFEEEEEEEEESSEHASIASRWFDGLISKDIQITNEVYSIPTIDFDRQNSLVPHYESPYVRKGGYFHFVCGLDVAAYTTDPEIHEWSADTDCCSWDGVTCDNVTGNVIGVDLPRSALRGAFHSNSSLLLPKLRVLRLSSCNLTEFPYFVNSLKTLTDLDFSFNRISGAFPSNSSLLLPRLSSCNLTEFPYFVNSLKTLTDLDLSFNRISGAFPSNSSLLLPKLRVLRLSSCNLTEFPYFLNSLKTLTDLDLSSN